MPHFSFSTRPIRRKVALLLTSFACSLGCAGEDEGDGSGNGTPATTSGACDEGALELDGTCVPIGPATTACAPGSWDAGGGECAIAGLPADMVCPPGTSPQGGACEAAGVPPEACGDGFSQVGVGCRAILPPAPCASGEIAVPGDTSCRPVADCGAGKWGNIPVNASTVYVDGSYGGGKSDGSVDKPWTTIKTAVGAAAEGSIVAIAAGTYSGQVALIGKSLKIWGRCPSMVMLQHDNEFPVLLIKDGADGTALHQLSVTGSANGVSIHGSANVVVDSLWIHDMGKRAFYIGGPSGFADVIIRNTLIERTANRAVRISGAKVLVERSAVRDSAAAIWSHDHDSRPANLTMRAALLAHNREAGMLLTGAETTVEDSQIQETLFGPDSFAAGISVAPKDSSAPQPRLTVKRSVIVDNRYVGIYVHGANATIDATTIVDTKSVSGAWGLGLDVIPQDGSSHRAKLSLTRSVVEGNSGTDVFVSGADALIEASVLGGGVADTGGVTTPLRLLESPYGTPTASVQVRASVVHDGAPFGIHSAGGILSIATSVVRDTTNPYPSAGGGIFATRGPYQGGSSDVIIEHSLVEKNRENIAIWGSSLLLRASLVRDGVPNAAHEWGVGVLAQPSDSPTDPTFEPANILLEGVLIERASNIGVFAEDSNVDIRGCIVRDTQAPGDGRVGQGIRLLTDTMTALDTAIIRGTLIERAVSFGLITTNTSTSVVGSAIVDTSANAAGNFGDALLFLVADRAIHASVTDTITAGSARASIASFGVDVALANNLLKCSALDINGERYNELPFAFSDEGGNACGCRGGERLCKQVSSGLTPPEPLSAPSAGLGP